jgi:type IV secretory pathway TrbF-like protein
MPDRVMAALQSVEIDRGRKHIVPEAIDWSTADRSDCECDEHVSGNSPLQQMRQDRVAAALESVQRGNTDRASMGHQQKKIRKEGLTIELPQEDGSVPERP